MRVYRVPQNKKLISIAIAFLIVLFMSPALSLSLNEIGLTQVERTYLKDKKVLRVCVDPDRLPFDGIDKNGKHSGLSKDYFEIYSRMLGVEMVVPEVRDWNDLIIKAKNRECDVVSQINSSEERKAFLDFTTPYFYLPLAVVTRYDRIFVEESLEGAGTLFAVVKNDIAIEKLKRRYPEINLVEVTNNIEALQMVYDGEVFGYIGAQGAVAFAIQSIDLDQLAVTGSLPLRYELSVATRNDEPLLGSAFEKAVLHIDPKEGQSIRDKWIAISIETVTDYTLLWQILGFVSIVIAILIGSRRRVSKANQKLTVLNAELVTALEEIKTLRGIIPICSYCKKIRNDEGAWEIMEAYISTHSDAQFSHGACPECYKEQMEELKNIEWKKC